jgi:hypothetical protein
VTVGLNVLTIDEVIDDQVEAAVRVAAGAIGLLRLAGKDDREIEEALMGGYQDDYMSAYGSVGYRAAKDIVRRGFERADGYGA